MIAKITRGAGFRGTVAYPLAREHQPEIVGGSMTGRDTRELAQEFAATRQARPDVEKPVIMHVGFLARVLGYAVPGPHDCSKDQDPPIEQDMPCRQAGRA